MEAATKIKEIKISQSIMKEYEAYINGNQCGLIIKDQYINGNFHHVDDPDDARNMGCWFEYQCTGALPKSGKIVEPKLLKSGDLNAKYTTLQEQVFNYHAILKEHGFEVLEAGKTITKNILTGTVDIIAKKDGQLCFIDLKTSAKIDDKWSEYGWAEVEHKPMITMQAIHYKILGLLEYNEEPDFYFFVFSSSNSNQVKIFKFVIDAPAFDRHLAKARFIKDALNTDELTARPEMKRCAECVLNETCKEKVNVPTIETVYIS